MRLTAHTDLVAGSPSILTQMTPPVGSDSHLWGVIAVSHATERFETQYSPEVVNVFDPQADFLMAAVVQRRCEVKTQGYFVLLCTCPPAFQQNELATREILEGG
jgi:GAF domain-containing protein